MNFIDLISSLNDFYTNYKIWRYIGCDVFFQVLSQVES